MLLPVRKATSGPLAGFPVLNIDFPEFIHHFEEAINKHVDYEMGGKAPNPGAEPISYTQIDCSGFMEDLNAAGTHGESLKQGMPDGSWNQDDWYTKIGFKRTNYANCQLNDGILRVGIHLPGGRGGDPTGHTWEVLSTPPPAGVQKVALSIESYGGHGPGRRPWNHEWFQNHVDHVYCLASIVPMFD